MPKSKENAKNNTTKVSNKSREKTKACKSSTSRFSIMRSKNSKSKNNKKSRVHDDIHVDYQFRQSLESGEWCRHSEVGLYLSFYIIPLECLISKKCSLFPTGRWIVDCRHGRRRKLFIPGSFWSAIRWLWKLPWRDSIGYLWLYGSKSRWFQSILGPGRWQLRGRRWRKGFWKLHW